MKPAVNQIEINPFLYRKILGKEDTADAFGALYRKCVNRDTSKDGTMDGVKMNITVD